MIIEKHHITGAWLVSDIIAGHLVHEQYCGFTKREAMKLFKDKHNARI